MGLGMSALRGEADEDQRPPELPLIAKTGHWWANENGGSGEPDRTPHLHNRGRLLKRDWYSAPITVHSEAPSAGKNPMTAPKAKLAGLALIAALCGGVTLGLTAPAWAGLDEATAAYWRGDYATAIREWRPLRLTGVDL